MISKKSYLEKELTEFANEIMVCCKTNTSIHQTIAKRVQVMLSTTNKQLETTFKKGDCVNYGTGLKAVVIEEYNNGLVKIKIEDFGETQVLKQDLTFDLESK